MVVRTAASSAALVAGRSRGAKRKRCSRQDTAQRGLVGIVADQARPSCRGGPFLFGKRSVSATSGGKHRCFRDDQDGLARQVSMKVLRSGPRAF